MCHDVISSATSAQFGDCYTNDRELNLQNALVAFDPLSRTDET